MIAFATPPQVLAELRSVFQNIDTDKDGKLSKEELGNMFLALGQPMPPGFWEESDPDGDGYILFEEFVGVTTGSSASGDGGAEKGEL